MRADEIEEQWALVDAIVATWQRDRPVLPNYPAGTWGRTPPEARGMASVAIEAWADDCATIRRSRTRWPAAARVGHGGRRTSGDPLTHMAGSTGGRPPRQALRPGRAPLPAISYSLRGDRLAAVFLESHPRGEGHSSATRSWVGPGNHAKLRPAWRCHCCSRSYGLSPLAAPAFGTSRSGRCLRSSTG
jgi:hypothetical protein